MIIDVWGQHPTLRHSKDPMFGTNYPMITPQTALADIEALELGEETQTSFLGGTAARVFQLSG